MAPQCSSRFSAVVVAPNSWSQACHLARRRGLRDILIASMTVSRAACGRLAIVWYWGCVHGRRRTLVAVPPRRGDIAVRLATRTGAAQEGHFLLGGLKMVREKVAVACKWPQAVARPRN